MRPAILAIDQGTTNTKALLVGKDAELLGLASEPTGVSHPQPGWAELSSQSIWESVATVIRRIVRDAGEVMILGVGVTNQRESALLWDKRTGRPVGPCVLWQCRRTSELCASLRATGREAMVEARTGLTLDPLFSGAKLAWLLDNTPGARDKAERGELLAGTVDSWVLWKLTGGVHATDRSNASRTQLLSLDTGAWDPELADFFGVPTGILPEVRDSNSCFGLTAEGQSALPAGVPIHAIMGDSHAALFGHGIESPGRAKVTCGTGSSLMTPTSGRRRSSHGLSSTIAWSRPGAILYALEGNITVSGEVAAFTTSLLGLADEAALTALAQSVSDCEGVVFVPALAGLGAPHWNDRARGMISGMSLATQPAHVARAALEAIALQIGDVLAAVEADLGHPLESLLVDGGASRNDVLMQLVADLLRRPVVRPRQAEISALGVARMAGQMVGLAWSNTGAAPADLFKPNLPEHQRSRILGRWREAVAWSCHGAP